MGGEVAWLLRNDDQHEDWIHFARYRAPEELYDTVTDPGCRQNLAKHPAYCRDMKKMRNQIHQTLSSKQDHELANFAQFQSDTR